MVRQSCTVSWVKPKLPRSPGLVDDRNRRKKLRVGFLKGNDLLLYLPRYYPLQKESLCAATSTENHEWFHERRSMNMHEPKWNHWNPSPVASSRIHNKVFQQAQCRIISFLILSSNYQDLPPHVSGTKPLIQSNTAVNSASSSSPAISVHSWQSSKVLFKDDIVSTCIKRVPWTE